MLRARTLPVFPPLQEETPVGVAAALLEAAVVLALVAVAAVLALVEAALEAMVRIVASSPPVVLVVRVRRVLLGSL
jgi:hypothetical protein